MDATAIEDRPGQRVRSEAVSPDELASLAEIGEMLHVPKRTVQRYAERPDFPEPIDRLATGRVWLRADVQAWGKAHLPLPPGRPRKPAA
jgi:prophage regulatory protein